MENSALGFGEGEPGQGVQPDPPDFGIGRGRTLDPDARNLEDVIGDAPVGQRRREFPQGLARAGPKPGPLEEQPGEDVGRGFSRRAHAAGELPETAEKTLRPVPSQQHLPVPAARQRAGERNRPGRLFEKRAGDLFFRAADPRRAPRPKRAERTLRVSGDADPRPQVHQGLVHVARPGGPPARDEPFGEGLDETAGSELGRVGIHAEQPGEHAPDVAVHGRQG